MRAYEILARIRAGLILAGRNEDGEYEWIGTQAQWKEVEKTEDKQTIW